MFDDVNDIPTLHIIMNFLKWDSPDERKGCPFHHRILDCKNRKSRATWSNKQVWPWSKK